MWLLQYNGAVEKGTYALLLAVEKEFSSAIGRLGTFTFPRGYYIYLGSARGGLYPRVKRHLTGEKRLRWHIDYLLEFAPVVEVWYALRDESQECLWSHLLTGMPQGKIIAPGFGSSDCRCPSHLIYFPLPPSFELFQRKLGEQGSRLKRCPATEFLSYPFSLSVKKDETPSPTSSS